MGNREGLFPVVLSHVCNVQPAKIGLISMIGYAVPDTAAPRVRPADGIWEDLLWLTK